MNENDMPTSVRDVLSGPMATGLSEPPHRQGYDRFVTTAPIVVFLGAGASAALDKPLMIDFVKDFIPSLPQDSQSILRAIIKHRGYDLEYILEDLQSMEGLSYVRNFQIGERHPNLPPLSAEVPGGAENIPNSGPPVVRQALERQVIRTYRSVPTEKAIAAYTPFFNLVFSESRVRTLPIFTTNYDPAIETFIGQPNYRLVTGFHTSIDGSFWSRSVYDSYSPGADRRNIVLFKLHGSANWIYDTTKKKILAAAPVHIDDDGFQNRLIYPARRKVATEDPYETAYDYFQRCCDRTKLLIVIGYSFRDYDALTRLKSSITRNPAIRCVYIGPNPEAVLAPVGLAESFQTIPQRFGVASEWPACEEALLKELDGMDSH